LLNQVQEVVLHVQGMKCAGCVQTVEKALEQKEGVVSASVNLVTEKATIAYQAEAVSASRLAIALTDLGFPTQVESLQYSKATDSSPKAEVVQRLLQIGMAAALVALSLVGHLHEFTGLHIPVLGELWFHWGLATVALLFPGRAMAIDGVLSLRRGIPNMNTLVSLGAWTAYLASDVALVFPQIGWECFFDAPVMIVGLVLLGRTLEEQARGQATSAFKALLNLQPAVARVVLNPNQDPVQSDSIFVEQVAVGTFLQVLPGDKFPVDGVIQTGRSAVNEAMLTGESRPVEKGVGDRVMAGTLNQSNAVVMEATRTGSETALAQIIQCVETAQARKAPIQRLADQVSGYFVYGVMAIAALTFLFWALVGTHLWPEVLHYAGSATHPMAAAAMNPDRLGLLLSLKLAIAVLVVACPCALGLATPTAIVVGTSLGAEQGLLIRGGDVLEAVHHLDTIVFDKTGTLTTGSPVVATYWLSAAAEGLETPERLIQLAASLENNAQHPFAEAVLAKATELHLERLSVTDWAAHPGAGLSGDVDGKPLCLGSMAWLEGQGVEVGEGDRLQAETLAAQGHSVVFLAVNGQYGGGIALQDPLRVDAVAAITALRRQKLKVLMLTGDQRTTAESIGRQLGLSSEEIYAAVSPTDKAKVIQALQAEGKKVGMVGDGINDAPALVQADVGIALSSGTDVAIETAQIVLMHSQLTQEAPRLGDVSRALKLSKATFRTIQQNLFWALGYNLIGIPLAAGVFLPAFGVLLNPAMAAALMAFSSVSVVTNALTLRRVDLG
jgi:P-type Cu2+ transporter